MTDEMLKFAIENGIINLDTIQMQIEMNIRKKYLDMHPYRIWEGADGKYHTYFPDEEKGRIPRKRNTLEEMQNLVVEFWKQQSENPTIAEVFEEWNDRKLELAKIAPPTHLRNKQIFTRHFKEFGERRIKDIDATEISDFLEEQIPKFNLTAKAFSNLKGITKGLLKRAKKRKLISFNVEEIFDEMDTSDRDFKKVIKEDYEEVFDEEELPVILKYLVENLDKRNLALLLMFVTGIRIGELVSLKNEVFEGNYFKIRRTETRYLGEDGKYVYAVKEYPKSDAGVRDVVIPEDYIWIINKIQHLNPFGEYIFVDDKGKRFTTNVIRRRLERIQKHLGIYHKSPHKIRKTYGTILLDNCIDKQTVIGQMGHSDIVMTEKHYHRNRKSIARKSEIISAIPDFAAL